MKQPRLSMGDGAIVRSLGGISKWRGRVFSLPRRSELTCWRESPPIQSLLGAYCVFSRASG